MAKGVRGIMKSWAAVKVTEERLSVRPPVKGEPGLLQGTKRGNVLSLCNRGLTPIVALQMSLWVKASLDNLHGMKRPSLV